jgi:hypothetical protein
VGATARQDSLPFLGPIPLLCDECEIDHLEPSGMDPDSVGNRATLAMACVDQVVAAASG